MKKIRTAGYTAREAEGKVSKLTTNKTAHVSYLQKPVRFVFRLVVGNCI